jgi:O-acetyl-ADP-ribose deacetylase (regulator of RNase III)
MIKLTQGDILKADAEALVNTVNCVGIMGRGHRPAIQKTHLPTISKAYAAACKAGQVQPGTMFVYDLNRLYNPPLYHQLPHQAPTGATKVASKIFRLVSRI